MPGSREPARLLLDEMFAPRIADDLRSRGIDCRAVAEEAGLRSLGDDDVLDAAVAEARTVVTNNVADFELLRRQRASDGRAIPPLVYTSDRGFPRDRRFIGRLVDALATAATEGVAEQHGGVCWLAPPEPQ